MWRVHVAVILSSLLRITEARHTVDKLRNLSTSVQWTCLANETVEVSINNYDYIHLTQSHHQLSLLHHSCQPENNGTHSVWKFSGGKCGSKTVNGNGYQTITNMLGLTSTSERKSSYQVVAVIACSYSTSPGCGAEEVIMPNMEWHFYRNDKLINFDLTSTPAVTKSKEGSWIHTVIQPEKKTVLDEQYKGAIAVTLETCSLEFENSTKAAVVTKVLFEKGCPTTPTQSFGYTEDVSGPTAQGITYILNLGEEAKILNRSDVYFAQLTCRVTLCVDELVVPNSDKEGLYLNIPKCQWYEPGYHCIQRTLGDPNPNLIQTLRSEHFVLQVQQSASSSTTHQMSNTVAPHRRIPTMDSSRGGNQMDRVDPLLSTVQSKQRTNKTQQKSAQGSTIIFNIYTAIIVCVACFLSGAATVAIFWILQSHRQKMKHQIRPKGSDVADISSGLSNAESREPITDLSSVDLSTSAA